MSEIDWPLWTFVLRTPGQRFPQEFKMRAPCQGDVEAWIARNKPEWELALDQYGNPCIARQDRGITGL